MVSTTNNNNTTNNNTNNNNNMSNNNNTTTALTGKERRILVIGSRSVGKTALTIQFTEERFQEDYNPTIESTHKKHFLHRNKNFIATIVDTAGQDDLTIFQQRHSIGIDGYILVYSITNRASFKRIRVLNDKILNATANEKIPRIIVGAKCDLESSRKVKVDEGKELAHELGCKYVECSAKTNVHIADVFHMLLDQIEGTDGLPYPASSSSSGSSSSSSLSSGDSDSKCTIC